MTDIYGYDLLCAAVIRKAYVELLDAYIFEAQMLWHDCSYNCAKRYAEYHKPKGARRYCVGDDDKQLAAARADIRKLTLWFTESERYRELSRGAQGEWFVRQAKEHTKLFALDKVDDVNVYPRFEKQESKRNDKKRIGKWKRARDAWRKAHGLEEVRDE